MINREWLCTLSDEKFYDELKRVEQTEGMWSTDTRRYMIDWLDAERRAGESEPTQEKEKQAITEEMKVHEEWYLKAREIETAADLAAFVDHLLTDYYHDYGTACHAVAACALAGACLAADIEGISHFQASLAMWCFIRQWLKKNNKCGMKLVDYDDMLYPQCKYKFDNTISKDIWESLQKEAEHLLEAKNNDFVAHEVRNHWQSIVDGTVPFGYAIKEDIS